MPYVRRKSFFRFSIKAIKLLQMISPSFCHLHVYHGLTILIIPALIFQPYYFSIRFKLFRPSDLFFHSLIFLSPPSIHQYREVSFHLITICYDPYNLSFPAYISMHILHTVLYTSPQVLTRGIC